MGMSLPPAQTPTPPPTAAVTTSPLSTGPASLTVIQLYYYKHLKQHHNDTIKEKRGVEINGAMVGLTINSGKNLQVPKA